jgi:hypothetical protein
LLAVVAVVVHPMVLVKVEEELVDSELQLHLLFLLVFLLQ